MSGVDLSDVNKQDLKISNQDQERHASDLYLSQ